MKIDLDYMNAILNTFIKSECSLITFYDWKKDGLPFDAINKPIDEKFIFHIRLLVEEKMISDANMNCTLPAIGVFTNVNGVGYFNNPRGMRLTQKGHDFANVLGNNEVIEQLKSKATDCTLDMIFDYGKKILNTIVLERFSDYL
ncbi:DUF2513 domain-containing protein [Vibrio cidicii]|nr:DUF2513 domain-containing protein [Vibrio cidicii]